MVKGLVELLADIDLSLTCYSGGQKNPNAVFVTVIAKWFFSCSS